MEPFLADGRGCRRGDDSSRLLNPGRDNYRDNGFRRNVNPGNMLGAWLHRNGPSCLSMHRVAPQPAGGKLTAFTGAL